MIQPDISILLPVYNGEKYLAIAIESILNQTFKNFELIIVNDGSQDNSLNIIESYKDDRIRIFNQSQKGLSLTLKNSISVCRSNFIARMDQDDISQPNRLEIQYKFLIDNPDVSVVSNSVIYIDTNGSYLGRSFPPSTDKSIKYFLLNKGCVINHPSVMFKKDDYLQTEGYCEDAGDIFSDYYLWLSFIKNGFKIRNIKSVLLKYRILGDSLSTKFLLSKEQSKILFNIIKSNKLNLETKQTIKQLYENSQKKSIENYNIRKFQTINFINKIYNIIVNIFGEKISQTILIEIKNYLVLFKII